MKVATRARIPGTARTPSSPPRARRLRSRTPRCLRTSGVSGGRGRRLGAPLRREQRGSGDLGREAGQQGDRRGDRDRQDRDEQGADGEDDLVQDGLQGEGGVQAAALAQGPGPAGAHQGAVAGEGGSGDHRERSQGRGGGPGCGGGEQGEDGCGVDGCCGADRRGPGHARRRGGTAPGRRPPGRRRRRRPRPRPRCRSRWWPRRAGPGRCRSWTAGGGPAARRPRRRAPRGLPGRPGRGWPPSGAHGGAGRSASRSTGASSANRSPGPGLPGRSRPPRWRTTPHTAFRPVVTAPSAQPGVKEMSSPARKTPRCSGGRLVLRRSGRTAVAGSGSGRAGRPGRRP